MIIADATALILFARVQRLELLHEVLGELTIPQAVANELIIPDKPGARDIQGAAWIQIIHVHPRPHPGQLASWDAWYR